jgi:hypothetical protein
MNLKNTPAKVLSVGADASQCLHAIVEAYAGYKIVAEEERTKRRGIEAWEKTTVTQIEAQRDALIKYLELSVDERSQNFCCLFEKVDNAIANGDNNQLNAVLCSITEIAKSSPFKDLTDLASVRTALNDPDHNWEF